MSAPDYYPAPSAPLGEEPLHTPASLLAMRLLIGYSPDEVGQIMGVRSDTVRNLESMKTHFVFEGYAKILRDTLHAVNEQIEKEIDPEWPPEFLFTFPNDGAFRDYAPEYSWMRFNSAHRMFTARLLDQWMLEGHEPLIVEIVPSQYEQWIEKLRDGKPGEQIAVGRPTMIGWARATIKVIRRVDGLPPQTRERFGEKS